MNRFVLFVMITAGIALGAAQAPRAPGAPGIPRLAYVSNERAGTVSVIETMTDRVIRTIEVGGRPRGLAARFTRLYVAISDRFQNQQGDLDAIVAIDAVTGRITARYDAGTDPERFVLSLDARLLIAANEDAARRRLQSCRRVRPSRRCWSASNPKALPSAPTAGGST